MGENETTSEEVCTELRRLLGKVHVELPELGARDGQRGSVAVHLGGCSLESARRLAELLHEVPAAMPAEGALVFDQDAQTVAVVAEQVPSFLWLRLPDVEECRWQADPRLVRPVVKGEGSGFGPAE